MITWQNAAVAVVALLTGAIGTGCLHAALTGSALVSMPILAAWLGAVAAMSRRAR